ncbi:lambda exonuclease family protein [Hyphomicrobium sp. CS1GBMeth3]|uniref:lambda exonuclease family protein n=1 Tax=Hyphomicrobium sp. CS1GBMeth3 TaxID=1892845 RepID=UPI000931DC02|nr:lambda exonuclease family protein [Hyphomicrobium sp. CS1GBMeth3]
MIEGFKLEVVDCEQGTPEWHAARAGIPTASEFATVLAKGRGGAESKTRKTYLRKLAAERITGLVVQTWDGNADTRRGHEQEPEARNLYDFLRDAAPVQVGFLRRGPVGCSPDSLVGEEGLLEIKTRAPHLQVEMLEAGVMPPEHKAQVQGQLWISGRKWVDFMSYCPGLPPFISRIERDPIYIAELANATKQFLVELDELTARIRAMQEAA